MLANYCLGAICDINSHEHAHRHGGGEGGGGGGGGVQWQCTVICFLVLGWGLGQLKHLIDKSVFMSGQVRHEKKLDVHICNNGTVGYELKFVV